MIPRWLLRRVVCSFPCRESDRCVRLDMPALQARAKAGRLYCRRSDGIALQRLCDRSVLRDLCRILADQRSGASRARRHGGGDLWALITGCRRSSAFASGPREERSSPFALGGSLATLGKSQQKSSTGITRRSTRNAPPDCATGCGRPIVCAFARQRAPSPRRGFEI